MMTNELAKMLTPQIRADILMTLDKYLRENITDEEIFMTWLEEGVPDGTRDASELLDIKVEEFTDMWNLAERLRNAQAAEDGEFDEPADIDDDAGYNPYMGCMDWDC